jgi:hypothetical protein
MQENATVFAFTLGGRRVANRYAIACKKGILIRAGGYAVGSFTVASILLASIFADNGNEIA